MSEGCSVTEALFSPANPEPLRPPGDLSVGTGPIKYERYTLKTQSRCDDCVVVLYEANQTGGAAPSARQARFIRKQGGQKLLLCAEHKHLRENLEQGRTGQLRAI